MRSVRHYAYGPPLRVLLERTGGKGASFRAPSSRHAERRLVTLRAARSIIFSVPQSHAPHHTSFQVHTLQHLRLDCEEWMDYRLARIYPSRTTRLCTSRFVTSSR